MFDRAKKLYAALQFSTRRDILSGMEDVRPTPGNPYPTYAESVLELASKYEGTAEWGCATARNVVKLRAAMTIGEGVQVKAREGKSADRELAFIRDFLRWNELDNEEPLKWAREAEIEGKFLAVLKPDKGTRNISARFIPWTQHRYEIAADPQDYAVYTGAAYKVNSSGMDVKLAPAQFVYRPFGGRTHSVNHPRPVCATVLREMESLDRAMTDWRKINNLFASQFVHIKCANKAEVQEITANLKAGAWRIGQALVTTAEAQILGMSTAGIDALEREITVNTKTISGTTGVPAHYLGYPDLLANRSTSDNLFDAMAMAVKDERWTWKGWYEELFFKALAMSNATNQTGFDPEAVTAEIAEADAAKVAALAETWLPLYQGGALSRETLLGKVPGVDAVAEEKRLVGADAGRAQALLDRLNVGSLEED